MLYGSCMVQVENTCIIQNTSDVDTGIIRWLHCAGKPFAGRLGVQIRPRLGVARGGILARVTIHGILSLVL